MLLSPAKEETVIQSKLICLKSQLNSEKIDSIENIKRTLISIPKNSEKSTVIKIRDILWHSGINLFKDSKYEKALEIYIMCLEFCLNQTHKDKLLRNIATCYLARGEVDAAKESLTQVKEECPLMSVLLFQVALFKEDEVKATELVEHITDEALLQTAAILAFKANSEIIATKTLHRAILISADPVFKLVAIRCLLRLSKSPQQDLNLYQMLEDIGEMSTPEITYFADSAWNSGLKAKPEYELMIKLLKQCLKITAKIHVPNNLQYIDRNRNCCVLIVAAFLQLASSQEEKEDDHLKSAMEYLSQFKSFGEANLDSTTTLILILYELECAVRLNMPNITSLIEIISAVDQVPLSTINRVVEICMSSKHTLATQTALRIAIEYHIGAPEPQWSHISKLFINIAKISPNIMQIFKSWSQYVDKFPEDEAAWMVCEAWNQGIRNENKGISQEMCTMALKISKNLPNYRGVYGKHMSQILDLGLGEC